MVSLLDSLLLVTLGFALGLLGRAIHGWFSSRSRRRRLATILSSEIQAIEASAKHSVEVNTPSLEETRRKYEEEPDSVSYIEIGDADFPNGVYERMLDDVGLFSTELVVLLTELYRWVDYAHHRKNENLKQGEDFHRFLRVSLDKELHSQELDYLRVKAGGTIHYATVYLEVVARVASLAKRTLTELDKIQRPKPRYRVDVKLDEILREKYP